MAAWELLHSVVGAHCLSGEMAVLEGRFKAAGAESGEGSYECKDLAGRAAALMDVIEGSISF